MEAVAIIRAPKWSGRGFIPVWKSQQDERADGGRAFVEDTVTGTAPREEERVPYFQETVPSGASASFYGNEATVEKGAQHFQFKGRFILTSVKSGLMLIDQHRAHVRVLFDRYMSQIRQKQGVSQGYCFRRLSSCRLRKLPYWKVYWKICRQ